MRFLLLSCFFSADDIQLIGALPLLSAPEFTSLYQLIHIQTYMLFSCFIRHYYLYIAQTICPLTIPLNLPIKENFLHFHIFKKK